MQFLEFSKSTCLGERGPIFGHQLIVQTVILEFFYKNVFSMQNKCQIRNQLEKLSRMTYLAVIFMDLHFLTNVGPRCAILRGEFFEKNQIVFKKQKLTPFDSVFRAGSESEICFA